MRDAWKALMGMAFVAGWCTQFGVAHQRTAPYTSAQNGRAERLHRTILDKARAMLISCNAPRNLWDEFCTTSAYLTNLTPSSSLQGRTPFELWYGRKPSLSHLREIGCRAFAFIPTSTPKTYARSRPCVLIGYSPHSKAYRLWDRESGRIFDSFHVSFLEHLDELPTDLFPGMTLTLSPNSPPSWDTASTPTAPKVPSPIPCTPTYPPTVPNFDIPQDNTDIPQNNTATNTTLTTEHQTTSSPTVDTPVPTNINPLPPTIPPIPNTPVVPPLRRSSRTRFSSAREATNDGLRPNSRLASAISNSTASSVRARATRSSRVPSVPEAHVSTFIDDLPSYDFTHAFLSEFSDFRDTHDLLPLDLPPGCDLPLDVFLSDVETGSFEPACDTNDDPSWKDALASPEREFWIAGARDELRSLQDLQVFVLVPRSSVPSGRRLLRGKLVCKRKRDDAGKVTRYKVRYVAKGFAQQPGIDFTKTTAPTTRLESFRSLLHLAATLGWDVQHFDIKTAFLHGILPESETAYMEQPPGFEAPGKETWVMQLMKSIYGMRQASRRWNETFHKVVVELGFQRVPCEWCVYVRNTPSGTVMFAVHVDDIFSISNPPQENIRFRDQLKSNWDISDLGPIKFALGIAIERNDCTISLSQTAFIDRVLEQFGQTDAHPVDTPMVAGLQLRRPDKSIPVSPEVAEWRERTPYRELVGSLNYVAVATRPDIAFAVGRLASFLDCFQQDHWTAAIRVLRYLKGTRTLSLTLGGTRPPSLLGYSDADFANCKDTSRSVSGYCYSLGSGVVSWRSRKQRLVADSTCYAEYIALHESSREAIFLRQLLDSLTFPCRGSTPIHCDNDAATHLAEDQISHSEVKHIRVKLHSIRDYIALGDIQVVRLRSEDNLADILTKPLNRSDFVRLRGYLGLRHVDTRSV